jgi:hypothetical protein
LRRKAARRVDGQVERLEQKRFLQRELRKRFLNPLLPACRLGYPGGRTPRRGTGAWPPSPPGPGR